MTFRAIAGPAALLAALATGCAVEAPTYGGCDEDVGCASDADGCYRVLVTRDDGTSGDAALCTRGCRLDAECPGGVCLVLAGDPRGTPLCWQRCATSSDCWSPLRCTPTSGHPLDPSVCMP